MNLPADTILEQSLVKQPSGFMFLLAHTAAKEWGALLQ